MFCVEGIEKNYGKKQVLTNINFSIEKGECVGLLGINGSGKSTLLSIISGGIKADKGRCFFKNEKGSIGFLPQDNPLISELSGIDNIKLWANNGTKDLFSETNQKLFAKLGVDAFMEKKVKDMSGGMKKRLSLAITMMSTPDLLLLDEPLAALDLLCKNGILSYLQEYLKTGGAIIIATHESSALDICTSIYSIKNGNLNLALSKSSSNQIFSQQEYVKVLIR